MSLKKRIERLENENQPEPQTEISIVLPTEDPNIIHVQDRNGTRFLTKAEYEASQSDDAVIVRPQPLH